MRLFILTLAIGVFVTSCGTTIKGNGNVVSHDREITGFHSIQVSGFFELELIEGSEKLEVVTDENLHEHILTEVKDGTLHIYTEDKFLDAEELLIRVHFSELNSIGVSGAAEIHGMSPIRGKAFELEVAGAAEAELEVEVQTLSLDLAGGSEVEIKGVAEMVEMDIAGAAEVKGDRLLTQQCNISISGAGEVTVAVDKLLEVDVTGAGEVNYKGNPEVRKTITGAGEVNQI